MRIDVVAAPFRQEQWYTIGQLRTVAAGILRARQSDRQLSAKLRTQRQREIPWAKSWNEELYPLKLLADHTGMDDGAAFCWTPFGAADFEIRVGGNPIKIQSTMAYAERQGTIGKQGAHVHQLEMEKFNADGFCFGGGLVSEPRASSPEEDADAWRAGIARALSKKLRPEYAGCRLLIFTPKCNFDTIDLEFEQVVTPAIEQVGKVAWENVFDGLYVLDERAFIEIRRERAN
jgi:hypothetical protein